MNTLVEHKGGSIKLRGPIEDYLVCVKCKGSGQRTYTSYSYYNPNFGFAGGIHSIWVGGMMACSTCRGRGYWKWNDIEFEHVYRSV